MRFRRGIPFLAAVLVCLGLSGIVARRSAAGGGFSAGAASKVTIPLFDSTTGRPMAFVRIREIRRDHQRKSFFRIGVMPLLVAEAVQIEVVNEKAFRGELGTIVDRITGSKSAPVELRDLEFRFPGAATPRLICQRVRCESGGHWKLVGAAQLRTGGEVEDCTGAVLKVTGPDAGEIVLAPRDPGKIRHLFTVQKENPTSPPL